MKRIFFLISLVTSGIAYGMSMSYSEPSMMERFKQLSKPHNLAAQDTFINNTGHAISINGEVIFSPKRCALCKGKSIEHCSEKHPEFKRHMNNLVIDHDGDYVLRYDGRRVIMGTKNGSPQLKGYSPRACSLIIALHKKSSIKPLSINDPQLLRGESFVIIHEGRLALVTKENVLRA